MVGMKLPRAKPARVAAVAPTVDATLSEITRLASILPPAAPASSDLNPLSDFIQLFRTIPLELTVGAKASALETNRQTVHTALHTLKAIFEHLIEGGRLHGVLKTGKRQKGIDGKEVIREEKSVEAVRVWLNERWNEYVLKCVEVATQHWDAGVRSSALTALLSLLRSESRFLTSLHITRQAQFANTTFGLIVRGLIMPGGDGVLKSETLEEWKKWWEVNDDIRFYFLKEASAITALYTASPSTSTSTAPAPLPIPAHLAGNLLTILEALTTMPTNSSELNSWWCSPPLIRKPKTGAGSTSAANKKRKLSSANAKPEINDGSTGIFDSSSSESEEENTKLSSRDTKKLLPPLLTLAAHRRAFQDCWLGLFSLPLDEDEAKRVLVILHRQVLPHMLDAKRVMDWLVDCTDSGGTIGILALNGLFTLMQKHNLEYPDFFTKLYALLDRDVLHVRYRPRFFRLLEIFMGSSHLPSALVAAFIKRLARLSLSAPPASIVTIIPFVYNMLKLHPGCMTMIHRPEVEGSDDDILNDPFDAAEIDPIKTNAAQSSLWELASLRTHYLASVSGLAKIFGEVMNKQSYAMEDFLDHSYGTMFESEVTRKIRNAPALAPVPARQPIGDSFFPASHEGKKLKVDGEEEEMAVDIVSELWEF